MLRNLLSAYQSSPHSAYRRHSVIASAERVVTEATRMEKVGIVTTTGCPHCKRAKAALKELGIEYAEVDLADERDTLAKITEITGQRTVPQIFIGGDFIGGASELVDLISTGKLQRCLDAVEEGNSFPQSVSREVAIAMAAADEKSISRTLTPEQQENLRIKSLLAAELPMEEIKIGKRKVTCASGTAVLKWIKQSGMPVKETIHRLLEQRVISPVHTDDEVTWQDPEFSPTLTSYYQLVDDAYSTNKPIMNDPLNLHYRWYGTARSAVAVSADLRSKMLSLYDTFLSADGKAVDYDAMAASLEFMDYVDTTVELQRVDLKSLSRAESMSFFINIYNALIVHGTVVFGSPEKLLKRLKFFGACKYVIGCDVYSADDCEHGILRNNAPSPASIGSLLGLPFLKPNQFPSGDKRLEQKIDPVDPRIHFALVCGAKSCPPIKLYTPENIDRGLQDAAVAFCDSEVSVVESTRTVLMSKIFKWYGNDFSKDDTERLKIISGFCQGETKAAIKRLLTSEGKISLKYKEYNWSPNSK